MCALRLAMNILPGEQSPRPGRVEIAAFSESSNAGRSTKPDSITETLELLRPGDAALCFLQVSRPPHLTNCLALDAQIASDALLSRILLLPPALPCPWLHHCILPCGTRTAKRRVSLHRLTSPVLGLVSARTVVSFAKKTLSSWSSPERAVARLPKQCARHSVATLLTVSVRQSCVTYSDVSPPSSEWCRQKKTRGSRILCHLFAACPCERKGGRHGRTPLLHWASS